MQDEGQVVDCLEALGLFQYRLLYMPIFATVTCSAGVAILADFTLRSPF